jgi:serine/threonine protein kinase
MSDSTASSLVLAGAMVGGKYRLDALIGEGGMGSVWAATHLGLNQAVAIKFVSKEFVKSAEALRRFDSEAKAAAALKSRHVVQVFDTGTLADETPYIAMELLHGESLQTRVHRGGPVPLGEAVEILQQCCRALSRAHAAGIVHRDIKPDNIFLAQSNDDDAYVVKILDFGVAKMGSGGNEQGSQGATRTGAVLGTPLYMSPEQARGLKTIDHRTDLYSLGLVAYTMFTGNLAFSSESFGDLLLQICTAPLPPLLAGAPWLPPPMEAWFARACAREPQERYASAQEFADGLRAAAGMPMQGRGPSLVDMSGSQGFGRGSATNQHAFASSGTSSGISRTGEAYVPNTGKRQLGIAVAIVSLLVGGAIVAAVVVQPGKQMYLLLPFSTQ